MAYGGLRIRVTRKILKKGTKTVPPVADKLRYTRKESAPVGWGKKGTE